MERGNYAGGRTRRIAIALALGCLAMIAAPASASAAFEITDFDVAILDADGGPARQAGSHPASVTTTFVTSVKPGEPFGMAPDGSPKDIEVDLPLGFVGDPTAALTCTDQQLSIKGCPDAAQIGTVRLRFAFNPSFTAAAPLYNMVPPPGMPAQLGFYTPVLAHLGVKVRGDHGITISSLNTTQSLPIIGAQLTVWGVPAASSHDAERGSFGVCSDGSSAPCPVGLPLRPFLSLPTRCADGEGLEFTMRANSWQDQAAVVERTVTTHFPPGFPEAVEGWGPAYGLEGCGELPFEPTLDFELSTPAADSPSGLDVELTVPQSDNPDSPASAHLERIEVVLPEGVAVNPASADGLAACTPAQAGLGSTTPAACPQQSKIGVVRSETPLLDHPIVGSVFLASQRDNPFGSTIALYLVLEDSRSGVVVKLPGRVSTDPVSGRVTTVFDDGPQLPFESMHLQLKDGARAPLVTPQRCGSYAIEYSLSSWGGRVVQGSDALQIDAGPGGGPCTGGTFDPRLSAGTTNPVAGSYSPFILRVTREDGEQGLSTIAAELPAGLLAKLSGVPYCPESALAGISSAEGSGTAQLAAPSCPAASQVGTVIAGAGAGPTPFYLQTGRAYLAGPYREAPLSLAFVTPALAGPFDLGSVLVRVALRVDPVTAEVTAASDPLPSILHGIPLNLRDVRVNLDRSGFTLNPTSCDPTVIAARIASTAGAVATPTARFQVAACERLAFEPKLSLRLKGATKRSGHPQLTAVLSQKPGGANIARASVAMPRSAFLAQDHIRTVCTRVQFAAEACPKGSAYGRARAFSPLLDKPLEGPVYLRSSNNPLPDLVADLRGQIDIELVGRIDSENGGIRTTFDTVPDAPVTRFVLRMGGGKRSLLENSRDLCASKNRATVELDAHSGKARDFRPLVRASCGRGAQR